jgi:hypothetical protein
MREKNSVTDGCKLFWKVSVGGFKNSFSTGNSFLEMKGTDTDGVNELECVMRDG